jgi:hypothetical protein
MLPTTDCWLLKQLLSGGGDHRQSAPAGNLLAGTTSQDTVSVSGGGWVDPTFRETR